MDIQRSRNRRRLNGKKNERRKSDQKWNLFHAAKAIECSLIKIIQKNCSFNFENRFKCHFVQKRGGGSGGIKNDNSWTIGVESVSEKMYVFKTRLFLECGRNVTNSIGKRGERDERGQEVKPRKDEIGHLINTQCLCDNYRNIHMFNSQQGNLRGRAEGEKELRWRLEEDNKWAIRLSLMFCIGFATPEKRRQHGKSQTTTARTKSGYKCKSSFSRWKKVSTNQLIQSVFGF